MKLSESTLSKITNDPIEIKYLADFEAVEAPAETGRTFAANARQKATYYAKKLGKPCIADDSGLEVQALDGAPGVRSARYAGEKASDEDNNNLLLHNLNQRLLQHQFNRKLKR